MNKFLFLRRTFIILLVLGLLGFAGARPALAQDPQPSGPVYVVQPGDSLWTIAVRFGVSLTDLWAANPNIDAATLKVGDEVVIPGLEGVQGRLETSEIGFGETLLSLSRRYQVPAGMLARLNRLSSPAELYVGADLIIPQQQAGASLGKRAVVGVGQSLLEAAVLNDVNPWSLAGWNGLAGPSASLAGDVLHLPGTETGPGALPPAVQAVTLTPLPMVQGETGLLKIQGAAGLQISGTLSTYELHFFSEKEGEYVALQGIHAMTQPGLYPLSVQIGLPGEGQSGFSQNVWVQAGGYPYDVMLYVDPETVDPENTGPEDQLWTGLASKPTPDKLWQGAFALPVDAVYGECWPSKFGSRRAYNDSAYRYFHTGLDFCGQPGHSIYAPAAGVVVFAGPLTVRGNATMIDHGWGIYTGYMHQTEIKVQVGERVEAGQLIGLVGNTGRVTGPHLHWEIWAGGVQVNPMDWLQSVYP